ncbi:hypothetical protein TcBrA4_0011110 [Trypanosoma cruzi]|nr:hypothetical protein TcBrA4_0011110 [Trypanosoma cruzi]
MLRGYAAGDVLEVLHSKSYLFVCVSSDAILLRKQANLLCCRNRKGVIISFGVGAVILSTDNNDFDNVEVDDDMDDEEI